MPLWLARFLCWADGCIWPEVKGPCLRCGKAPGVLTYL
jgi:hypothetical protein